VLESRLLDHVERYGLACRLPLPVDLTALERDLGALPPEAWVGHFNTRVYQGDWSGAAFRAPGGDASRLYPDLTGTLPFEDTPLRAACPGVDALMRSFACPLLAVRFLRLGPGARILPHRDYDLGFRTGEVRLHVPVITSPEVAFVVAGVPLPMSPGEVWYADFDRVHHVHNSGLLARVHLVLDCVVNDWLLERFEGASDHIQVPPSAS
jgi:hypothetical protein